jgi:DMSO/TMAO reductase YedYZ heme-binding membrane subunit
VASTRSRPRGREQARPVSGGPTAEHATKIYGIAIAAVVAIVAFLALTSAGHVIDAATQQFMLYYAGVFALIALCGSVALGLIATDRMILHPGHRIFVQSAHRAASFGAVAFLIIHIVTEILAQRVHVLDAFVPFLSPFRTFYIGLGTIASDLVLLLVITGILRKRFTAHGGAWRWRAIHYTAYLSFVFGVWHGLLGGRPGKPYVDWSYGFVVAFVLLGLAVRVLSNSLRPKENLSAPPVDQAANSASAPLRAAAMLAQYGAARGNRTAILGAGTGSQPVMSAPLSAPVLTALPAAGDAQTSPGQPYYEPGYEGPPRYLGAPRNMDTGPMPQAATGPMPRAATGPLPRAATGPMPRTTGSMPRLTGPQATGTGPLPRTTGSMPMATGPMPRPGSGPIPRPGSGPIVRPGSGPIARPNSGPLPQPGSGVMPRDATGPMPRAGTGPYPVQPARPQSRTGSMPRVPTGPLPQGNGGRSMDSMDRGTVPLRPSPAPGGPGPRGGTGPQARPRMTGPVATGANPYQQPATVPTPQGGRPGPLDRQAWPNAGSDGNWYPEEPLFPETDPNLKYREPGPGMPGYRGSREQRYGGDRFQ